MPTPRRSRNSAGFTVVELLVVLAIIILLVGILLVGLSQAAGTAQATQTRFLMNSMSAGLVQFKKDHGYLPPVLGDGGTPVNSLGWARDVLLAPAWSPTNPDGGSVAGRQAWYSVTSPAEYLLGYGDRTSDGYGLVDGSNIDQDLVASIETPTLGFRAPGGDGAWGAVFNQSPCYPGGLPAGVFGYRNPGGITEAQCGTNPDQLPFRGRIYGPYIELKDSNLLGGLRTDGTVARPEDPDYAVRPKVILDYWGTPIRYYRNPYLDGDPRTRVNSLDLADVFALRPWTVQEGVEVDGLEDAAGDSTTSPRLKSGEFALMSLGPDRSLNAGTRVDESEFNRDNIVEIGP